MPRFVFSLFLVFTLLGASLGHAEDASRRLVELKPGKITEDTVVQPFEASYVFRYLFAGYRSEIDRVKVDRDLEPAEREKRVERLTSEYKGLLKLYDQVLDISPVVYSISIQLGLELPLGFTRALIKRFTKVSGELALQGSAGITFVNSRNQIVGEDGKRDVINYAVSYVTGVGPNVGGHEASARKLITIHTPSVVVIFPHNEEVESKRIGDFQGWHIGAGPDLSFQFGGQLDKNFGWGGSLYAPSRLGWPEHIMFYGFVGFGGNGNKVQVFEKLYFGILNSTDGSTPRAPLPFAFQFLEEKNQFWSNEHERSNRIEAYERQTREVLRAIDKAQRELEMGLDVEKPEPEEEDAEKAEEERPDNLG